MTNKIEANERVDKMKTPRSGIIGLQKDTYHPTLKQSLFIIVGLFLMTWHSFSYAMPTYGVKTSWSGIQIEIWRQRLSIDQRVLLRAPEFFLRVATPETDFIFFFEPEVIKSVLQPISYKLVASPTSHYLQKMHFIYKAHHQRWFFTWGTKRHQQILNFLDNIQTNAQSWPTGWPYANAEAECWKAFFQRAGLSFPDIETTYEFSPEPHPHLANHFVYLGWAKKASPIPTVQERNPNELQNTPLDKLQNKDLIYLLNFLNSSLQMTKKEFQTSLLQEIAQRFPNGTPPPSLAEILSSDRIKKF